jgi:hypothetical protein
MNNSYDFFVASKFAQLCASVRMQPKPPVFCQKRSSMATASSGVPIDALPVRLSSSTLSSVIEVGRPIATGPSGRSE